jgi:hypothetical protein
MTNRVFLVGAMLTIAAAIPTIAAAWFAPSYDQTRAIKRAFHRQAAGDIAPGTRYSLRDVRVSSVDRRWASLRAIPAAGATDSAYALLRQTRAGWWRLRVFGTEPPRCDITTARIRRDLLGTPACVWS